MEATKRPWKQLHDSGLLDRIVDGNYNPVVSGVLPEDAALIVRAVNTFDQAKAALKAARGVINSSMLDMASLNDGRAPLEHVQVLRDIDKAIAAMEAPQ